jgi:DnaJ-class molecular chaperone
MAYHCPGCDGRGKVVRGSQERECAMCRGKGSPPCLMCSGDGKIKRSNPEHASYPTAPCESCKGNGFDQSTRCLICSGSGENIVGKHGETAPCWYCKGTGEAAPLCQRCRGLGLTGPNHNRYPCPDCFATGKLWVRCASCRGQGYVKKK